MALTRRRHFLGVSSFFLPPFFFELFFEASFFGVSCANDTAVVVPRKASAKATVINLFIQFLPLKRYELKPAPRKSIRQTQYVRHAIGY